MHHLKKQFTPKELYFIQIMWNKKKTKQWISRELQDAIERNFNQKNTTKNESRISTEAENTAFNPIKPDESITTG
jgi:hypothetical protein